MDYLEKPSYEEHDVYRALDVLASECDFIQSEAYKNSSFQSDRNDGVLYYDCTNYYFETEQEDEHSFPPSLWFPSRYIPDNGF